MVAKHGLFQTPHFYIPFPAIYKIKSLTLHEYPHSLSYHARTLTILFSITFVERASTMDELEFPLKSIETNGSSQYWRMPLSSPSAAFLNAAFTSSAVVSLSNSATRSTTETFGVGTLIAIPSSFPFNCGRTRETAFAAPVVVGIIDSAAALALRQSLCGRR